MVKTEKNSEPRISLQALRILRVFLDDQYEEQSGSSIAGKVAISSGSLYPILLRLEKAGWLTSQWENIDPSLAARPRRRYYRLTALGAKRSSEILDDFGVKALRQ